jgi:hypothetical protein
VKDCATPLNTDRLCGGASAKARMTTPSITQSEYGEPIVFRTTAREVYASSLESGSLWLRSDRYYRSIEDPARSDSSEGVNSSGFRMPFRLHAVGGHPIQIVGDGTVGQEIVPHYIASFHGLNISPDQRNAFGGYTFGVRSFSRLAAAVLFECTKHVRCGGYRFGQISYQHTSLAQHLQVHGSAAIQLADNPPVYLNPVNTDVLRKAPIHPFIEQDEWRIVVFTDGYIAKDEAEPLRINVPPDLFYPYLAGVAKNQDAAAQHAGEPD